MNETEQLIADVGALRKAIANDWAQLDELALTERERAMLRLHLTHCMDELLSLLKRLNETDPAMN